MTACGVAGVLVTVAGGSCIGVAWDSVCWNAGCWMVGTVFEGFSRFTSENLIVGGHDN
jgi:hypothetical protein